MQIEFFEVFLSFFLNFKNFAKLQKCLDCGLSKAYILEAFVEKCWFQASLEEDREMNELTMFFAKRTPMQDALFSFLQETDKTVGGGTALVMNFFKKLILTCADNFSKGKYIVPSEKEDYLKIISCCLKFIMATEKKFETNSLIFSVSVITQTYIFSLSLSLNLPLFQRFFSNDEKKMIIKCYKSISVLKDFGDVPIDENQLLIDMTGKPSDTQNSIHDRSLTLGPFQDHFPLSKQDHFHTLRELMKNCHNA